MTSYGPEAPDPHRERSHLRTAIIILVTLILAALAVVAFTVVLATDGRHTDPPERCCGAHRRPLGESL